MGNRRSARGSISKWLCFCFSIPPLDGPPRCSHTAAAPRLPASQRLHLSPPSTTPWLAPWSVLPGSMLRERLQHCPLDWLKRWRSILALAPVWPARAPPRAPSALPSSGGPKSCCLDLCLGHAVPRCLVPPCRLRNAWRPILDPSPHASAQQISSASCERLGSFRAGCNS